ncbi:MAG: metallophosphatase [Psychroflexus sp.]|nr:metallophosphatase [Psychroflexus sp.]MDN6310909.1 metallophosphatase [Psychroflexus sp.]
MKRSDFIKTSVAATAIGTSGLGLLSSFTTPEYKKRISILHTNDVHSHIDPFPADHTKYPNLGGAARRMNYIQKIKAENPNTLILDAGDAFQGTPYFNFYGGELEYKVMSKLGYHASTIGNHEFDNGIDNIAAQLAHAKFDMINTNYDLKNTSLDGLVKKHQIYEVDQFKIGIFGVGIELAGLVSKDLYKEAKYLDPIDIAKDEVRYLKDEQKCDLVICLSHIGYAYKSDKVDDVKLAKATQGIDLIIGGHTHTFLDEPQVFKNSAGEDVMVNQVGWAGLQLGHIEFYFDEANQVKAVESSIAHL